MNHHGSGILVLLCSALMIASPPLARARPAAASPQAGYCHSSLGVPFDLSLKATNPPTTPGSRVSVTGEIKARADLGSISLAYETFGPAQVVGAAAGAAPAAMGDSRTFTFDVGTSGTEPWSVTVHVVAASPDGQRTWEYNASFYGMTYNGRLLTGMGSFLQLQIQAIEDDYHAGILNEKEARDQTKALLQINGAFDQTPRGLAGPMSAREQAAWSGLKSAPAPDGRTGSLSPAGGCHHIEGNVSWLDENGNLHPAFGIAVQIWDEDLGFDEHVADTITDTNGNYSIDVDDDDGIGAGSRDIYVKILSANGAISIEPAGIFTSPYEADSPVHDEAPCGTIVENFTAANTGTGPAVNLCECGSWRASYVAADFRGGSFLPQIVAEWPGSPGSANYDGSDINLRPGDQWDWDVFMHEYGHYVQDVYNIEDNPGGPHNIGDCISDVHASKDEGVKMGWAEGWPTYDGTVAQFYYNLASKNIPRVGDADYADTGESNFNYGMDTQDSNGLGEDNEIAMQRVFWDLWDNVNDGRDNNVSTSEVTLFNIVTGNNSETLSQAWGAIRATLSNADQLAYGAITTDHQIGPSLTSPANNAIVSPSSNNNFSWNRNVGCSTTYDGDSFTLRFFRSDNAAPILSIPVGNTTSHALTLGELQTIVAATHNVRWAVEGSNSSSPATGPYLGENFAAVINQPPVADAGPDQTVECTSYTTTPVQLNGTGSSDPDGDNLTYTWSATGVTFNDSHSATPIGQFPDGTTVVTLTVSDGLEEDTDTVSITVEDTTPPIVSCPADTTVECNDHCAGGGVPRDDASLAAFFAGFTAVDVCDPTPTLTNNAPACFPVGQTTVTFYAEDDDNNIDSCTAVVTVQDTTPPEISVELNRDVLWPPNHKMSPIEAAVVVTDICDPNPTFVLTSITSDEPDNGLGDGDTPNDIQEADYGTADLAFLLRSERAGLGDGRVYTIIYTASDASGNTADDTVYVRVPHDQSGNALAAGGFNALGNGFTAGVETCQLVVPSSSTFNAGLIDARSALVGNYLDVVRPYTIQKRDANGDGLIDLVLAVSIRSTLDLRSQSTKRDPLGLHYRTTDGTDYLVADIFGLGRPIPTIENEGNKETDAQVDDGSGGTDASESQLGGGDLSSPTAFEIREAGRVTIDIFTVTGRKVRTMADHDLSAGRYDLAWDGRDDAGLRMASGIYFYRISGPGLHEVRKIHIAR